MSTHHWLEMARCAGLELAAVAAHALAFGGMRGDVVTPTRETLLRNLSRTGIA